MLRHPHAEGFRKAADKEYKALKEQGGWEIVDRATDFIVIPIKWMFIYKHDPDSYSAKYKARLVVRGALPEMNNQYVYIATLAFKVFRVLVALSAAFSLHTRQLDALNAFLYAHNDEVIYCHMPDDYSIGGKVMKVIKALRGQRRSPLLWLRILTKKCFEIGLSQIPGKPCLFTDRDGIFLVFYPILVYRLDRQPIAETYIRRLRKAYEIRDLGQMSLFLGVGIVQNFDTETVALVQDSYMD